MTLINPPHRSKPGRALRALRPIAPPATTALFERDDLLMLYQSIMQQLDVDRPAILAVTSATHGEGVSSLVRELGGVVASELGQAVLSIVASRDSEGPSGLEAVVEGFLPLEKVIEPDLSVPQLYHAQLNTGGSRAGLLFDSAELDRMLRQLVRFTRLVLVDTPPVLSDVTALAFARRAAGVLLVVEAEKTRAPLIEKARQQIERADGRLCGVVLNKRRQHIPDMVAHRL